jgi:hypothetical protein
MPRLPRTSARRLPAHNHNHDNTIEIRIEDFNPRKRLQSSNKHKFFSRHTLVYSDRILQLSINVANFFTSQFKRSERTKNYSKLKIINVFASLTEKTKVEKKERGSLVMM